MPTKRPNTADIAKYSRRGGQLCGVCASPHRQFIEDAVAAGHDKLGIARYMAAEIDPKFPVSAVSRHFQNGHHLHGGNKKAKS